MRCAFFLEAFEQREGGGVRGKRVGEVWERYVSFLRAPDCDGLDWALCDFGWVSVS